LIADTHNHRVVVMRRAGAFVCTFGKFGKGRGEFHCPSGVALQGGSVFVADTFNHRVVITDLQGSHFIYLGGDTFALGNFMCPCHVFCDGTHVFVTDHHRVVVVDLEGRPVCQLGEPDEMIRPTGAWVYGVDVFVADSGNCRVLHCRSLKLTDSH
jgi:DNA-binding beta-propeller fold protein YncE